ncbi:hypothetical protein [Moritella sp.]|uniref:hypothetical protein n=1 Tax=Moritella sp. TaxID=78556 RepID=UPI001D849C23|nr:hypothetical protein [Moritella sp.]MCJ8350812.1 hypothetical protein [Moritella sp.]NQZ40499.1 hypothetical protein [Moritella sp.]
MRKSIITSVLASVLLSGCGSGGSDRSDSGSGSSSTPTTKYTLQFVQLVEEVEGSATSCTLFDITGQSVGMQTYARLASDVRVKTYDADGNFNKDLSDLVSNTGVLNITESDIDNGGYISIINSESSSSTEYEVLSIQKELLGDIMIAVERNQGVNSSCYKENPVTVNTGFASVYATDTGVDAYAFSSSQSEFTAGTHASKEVSALNNEDVLVRAYHNDKLVDYAFVSTLTVAERGDQKPLSGFAFSSYNWSINQTLTGQLFGLSVRLNQGNYSYPWLDATFDTVTGDTTGFARVYRGTSWSYSAEGKTNFDWNFKHNEALSATLDVQLPTELTLTDNDPEISNFVFQAQGIDSTLTRLQRSSYYIEVSDNGKTNKLNHVIYSEVASGDDVIIPNLGLANLDDPMRAINLTIAVLSADKLTSDFKKFFMYENAASDLVSVVLTPTDTVKNNKTKNTGSYTLLNR